MSVEYENESKVKWHMPSWYVNTMTSVWTKHGEPGLYGNGETDLPVK